MTTKHLFLACALAAIGPVARAQCTPLVFDPTNTTHTNTLSILTLDIKANFCATGDGVTNDQAAFDAASDFIKKRGGYCKLTIPNGVYRAGRQDAGYRGWYQWPVGVLRLDSVKHVEVAGQGAAQIRLLDNMKYGFFDPATGLPVNVSYETDTLRPYAAGIGDLIRINIAEDISIHDLVLDGNLYPGKMIIGGREADPARFNGIQEAYSGIGIYYARGVKVTNVTTRRFGLDGLLAVDYDNSWNPALEAILPNTGRIYINQLNSDFNGRQGASFVWGDSIFVSNSSFTNTGMGEITYSGLQAGIDIEPEDSGIIAENFFFDSCLFDNNRNANIAITSGKGIARNIYFTHCKSYNIGRNGNEAPAGSAGFNNVALDIGRHQNINFTDCEFKGYVYISKNTATSAAEGYKFKRCLFSDCYQKRVSWTTKSGPFYTAHCALVRQKIENISTPLIFAPWTQDGNNRWEYVTIDSSIFDLYDRRPWLSIQATYDKPTKIKNSTIYVNNMYVPNGSTNTTVLSDNFVMIENNKIFLHNYQHYVHDGVTITGAGNNSGNWGSIQFTRWSSGLGVPPPNVCADTVMISCFPGGGLFPISDHAELSSESSYVVYPNPATEKRFDLSNRSGETLYYEFLGVNGGLLEKGELKAHATTTFRYPQLSAGIYYLKVVRDKAVKVEKIVLR